MKQALISGTTGQDGSYLVELLLKRGYTVHASIPHRHAESPVIRRWEAEGLFAANRLKLVLCDMTDKKSIDRVVKDTRPDEVYNLAAQSFVGRSWDLPDYTFAVNATGFLRLLDACAKYAPKAHIYQASTSEMFGDSKPKQNEQTAFKPCSPYAQAKVFAHKMGREYRKQGMFVCMGILFNHESPRRGEHFVTQKIAKQAVEIKYGQRKKLRLGNPDAARDWGHAREYVEFMHRICTHSEPDEFVVGTGQMTSVREFVKHTFASLDLNPDDHVVYNDPEFLRPTDVPWLQADTRKLEQTFGVIPQVRLHSLIAEMVQHWRNRLGVSGS